MSHRHGGTFNSDTIPYTKGLERLQSNDPTFRMWDLSGTPLTENQVGEIAQALKANTHLKELHMRNCGVTNEGCSTFIFSFNSIEKFNTTLTLLDLSNNQGIDYYRDSVRGWLQLYSITDRRLNVRLKLDNTPAGKNSEQILAEAMEPHMTPERQANSCVLL